MSVTTLKGMFALFAVVTFLKCKTTANGDQETLAKELSWIPRLSLFAPSLCGYVQCSICVLTTHAARLTSLEPRGRIFKFVTLCSGRPRPLDLEAKLANLCSVVLGVSTPSED